MWTWMDMDGFDRSMWCLDNDATSHMCCQRELFTNFEEHNENKGLAGVGYLKATGKGDVILQTDICVMKLINVLFVPEIKGCIVKFCSECVNVVKGKECILN